MKNIEHTIKVNRPLISNFHRFYIGKSAWFDLRELRHNSIMVKYLCEEHTIDPYCIVGNIGELYRIRKEIFRQERIGKMTYREHLQEQIRNGLFSLPKENE